MTTAAPTRRTIARVLDHAADTWPNDPAIVFEGTTLTFAQLRDAALDRLGAIQSEGIGEGDTVLVMMENSEDTVITWLALALGGCIEVPVNTAYIGEMLAHLVRNSGATAVITQNEFIERLQRDGEGRLTKILVSETDGELPEGVTLLTSPGPGTRVSRTELDQTAIMYTSGTTGPSKGGRISERHAYEYAASVTGLLELRHGDVYYAPLPMFHIAGRWAVVYAAIQRDACTVLVRRFSISTFWDDVRRHGVTTTFLLGAMAQFVYNQPPAADDADNSLDRALVVPLIERVDDFRKRFDVRVTTCFGSTEANVPLIGDWDVALADGVGKVRPGYHVRLVDSDERDVATGVPGEMLVATDEDAVVLMGYHANEDATRAALRDGWLHTGDVFKQDEAGNYHFVDRVKDALRKRGENISSFEVEREVRSHPAVMECAVVGQDSIDSEQEIVAFVQLHPGHDVTADDIRAHVAERAPKFMVPDHIHFIDDFPMTPTGKIQKFELRKTLPS